MLKSIFHHAVNTHMVIMLLCEFYDKHTPSSIQRACFIDSVFAEFFDIHAIWELNSIIIVRWYVNVHCKGAEKEVLRPPSPSPIFPPACEKLYFFFFFIQTNLIITLLCLIWACRKGPQHL